MEAAASAAMPPADATAPASSSSADAAAPSSSTDAAAPATAGPPAADAPDVDRASKRARHEPPPDQQPNPSAKRKVALLVAYNGAGYQGLQKNPGATTIEDALEKAMHQAGAISDDNYGSLQKVWWSRAGRTDKGVHAVGQLISLKMILNPEPMVARINERLAGTRVRILGCERVTGAFCAKTFCSAREYEYLLPSYCLRPARPAGADPDADAVPLSAAELARLASLLRDLQGTHSFHNFTDKGKLAASDKSATRYLYAVFAGEQLTLRGQSYVPLRYHGQSFILHQIRKMTGLVAAIMRGVAPHDAIGRAITAPRVTPIPLSPACALVMCKSLYSNYEKRRPAGRASVHFDDLAGEQRTFMADEIWPSVAAAEAEGEFSRFAEAVDAYRFDECALSQLPPVAEPGPKQSPEHAE